MGLAGSFQIHPLRVAGDADDFAGRIADLEVAIGIPADDEAIANNAAAGPPSPRHVLTHNCHRRRVGAVAIGERAPPASQEFPLTRSSSV